MLFEEAEQVGPFLRELVHLTLLRRFVRSPTEQLGSMAETTAGDMIVANFDVEFRLERVPDVLFPLVPPVKPGGTTSFSSCFVKAGRRRVPTPFMQRQFEQ